MDNMFQFKKQYFIIAILIFVIEILIAVYAHDKIVRPYAGDLLVVILLYCVVKTFLNVSPLLAGIIVLLFSFTLEILQYFHLVNLLGLQNSKLATIILGTSFQWLDLLCYSLGIAIILYIEKLRRAQSVKENNLY